MCDGWQSVKIVSLEIQGGNVSKWIQRWVDELRKSGAYKMGFKGVEYLYPPDEKSVGESKINVRNIPAVDALRYMADACMFEYRINGDHVLIQPDRKYVPVVLKVTDKFVSGIGLDIIHPFSKREIAEKVSSFGVKIDNSPDSITVIGDQMIIQVMAIDKKIFESIVDVANSGLLVSIKSLP